MRRARNRLGLTALLLLALTMAGGVFLALIGIDALESRNTFQFFADSGTYHAAARGDLLGIDGLGESIGVAGNFLGPLLLLQLAGENYYVVMVFNALLLYLSIASISKSLRFDSLRFTLLLLVNPLTVSSLLSVNKEIFSLVFIALLLRAYAAGSVLSWIGAVLVSLLVRWQLTVFLFAFSAALTPLNPLRRNRLLTIVILLVGLSILYLQLAAVFEPIRYTFEQSAAEYEGSGFYEWLQGWQDSGAYWLIFPLKAAHLLFGLGLRFDRLIAPVDIYNDVWQLLHSTMTLVLFIALCKNRAFKLRNDLIYVSVFYVAIFALSPIYSPRYFYPVYVLWAATLAARRPIVSLWRTEAATASKKPVRKVRIPFVQPATESTPVPRNTQ